MIWRKATKLIVSMAVAGIPLAMSASCDPYSGSLSVYRYDNHNDGWFGNILDDWFGYECDYWDGCYTNDYYYDEIVIWD